MLEMEGILLGSGPHFGSEFSRNAILCICAHRLCRGQVVGWTGLIKVTIFPEILD